MVALTAAQPADEGPVVNIMVEADITPSADEEEAKQASTLLNAVNNELRGRGLGATVFATDEAVSSILRLRLTLIGRNENFELGMSGGKVDEKLSTKPLSEQKSILERSKDRIESCRVCGEGEIIALGFLPQSFDQNEETYKVLDELRILYNAGYQAGVIYAPGGEDEVWPYPVEGTNFYAVPVSTSENVPLHDRYFAESGMTSAEWYDALVSKFDEAEAASEPVVILLTASISGTGDYLDALSRFLDYAVSKDASFVTTLDLVKTQLPEGYVLPVAEECVDCIDEEEGIASIDTEMETPAAADNSTIAE
jgi:hypothetical protein